MSLIKDSFRVRPNPPTPTGTDLYLKLGTVGDRTTLLRHDEQPIGIDPSQDVEDISLDRTFEDVDSTEEFLGLMLDELCRQAGIEAASEFVSDDGLSTSPSHRAAFLATT